MRARLKYSLVSGARPQPPQLAFGELFINHAEGTVSLEKTNGQIISIGQGSVNDHAQLVGLNQDDHPQYLTAARADARYWPLTATINGGVYTGG